VLREGKDRKRVGLGSGLVRVLESGSLTVRAKPQKSCAQNHVALQAEVRNTHHHHPTTTTALLHQVKPGPEFSHCWLVKGLTFFSLVSAAL
jgi:hypothetical protein